MEGSVKVGTTPFQAGVLPVFSRKGEVLLAAKSPNRLVLMGGEPMDGPRHLTWNLVSISPERIQQAKEDWKAQRFPRCRGRPSSFLSPRSRRLRCATRRLGLLSTKAHLRSLSRRGSQVRAQAHFWVLAGLVRAKAWFYSGPCRYRRGGSRPPPVLNSGERAPCRYPLVGSGPPPVPTSREQPPCRSPLVGSRPPPVPTSREPSARDLLRVLHRGGGNRTRRLDLRV